MIRKLLTSLLCLLLALSLPLCAFAANQTTISVGLGDELAQQQFVKDLLDVVAIRVVNDAETGAAALSVLISDESVVTAAFRADEEGIFAQSDVLGDKTVFIGMEDLQELMKEAMEQSGTQLPMNFTGAFDLNKLLEDIIKVASEDAELIEAAEDIANRAVVTDGEFASELHDTAERKTELTLANADYVKFIETKTVRYVIETLLKMSNPAMSESDINAQIDSALDEAKKAYEQMDITEAITAYTVDGDKTLVALTVDTQMVESQDKVAEGEKPQTVLMPMSYNRLTVESGALHTVSIEAQSNDKTEAVIKAHLNENNDGTANGLLGILAGPQEINVAYNRTVDADAAVNVLDVYTRSGATSLLEPAASDRPIISLKVETKEVSGEELAAVAAATKENSVELLKMSQDEAQEFGAEVTTRASQLMFAVLSKMPASVLENLGALIPMN